MARLTGNSPEAPSSWGPVSYFRRLVANFTPEFVAFLFVAYLFTKGFAHNIVGKAALPTFKGLGVDASQFQRYGAMAMAPWSMKAIVGMISDSVPIFGYNKRYYILLSAVVGVAGAVCLATIKLTKETGELAWIFFFMINLQIASVDLLTEGKYAELMMAKPTTSSDLVTFVWANFWLGAVIALSIAGPLLDSGTEAAAAAAGNSTGLELLAVDAEVGGTGVVPLHTLRILYWMMVPPLALIIVPTVLGFLPEEKATSSAQGSGCVNTAKMKEQQHLYKLGCVMAVAAVVLLVANAMATRWVLSGCAVGCSVLCLIASFIYLPRTQANCNAYMFFVSSFYIDVGGMADYFFTASSACVPNGPNFDYTFYFTYAGIAGSAMGLLGVAVFQTFFHSSKFRTVFLVTISIKTVTSFCDIVILERWNVNVLGISDKVWFFVGDAVLQPLFTMLEFMPAVVLTSKICPKGVESTTYAILAGFQNFGGMVSSSIGSALINVLKIKTVPTDGQPCDFSNASLLYAIGHCGMPLVLLPLVFFLIPDVRLDEDVLGKAKSEDEEGLLQPEHPTQDQDVDPADPSVLY